MICRVKLVFILILFCFSIIYNFKPRYFKTFKNYSKEFRIIKYVIKIFKSLGWAITTRQIWMGIRDRGLDSWTKRQNQSRARKWERSWTICWPSGRREIKSKRRKLLRRKAPCTLTIRLIIKFVLDFDYKKLKEIKFFDWLKMLIHTNIKIF